MFVEKCLPNSLENSYENFNLLIPVKRNKNIQKCVDSQTYFASSYLKLKIVYKTNLSIHRSIRTLMLYNKPHAIFKSSCAARIRIRLCHQHNLANFRQWKTIVSECENSNHRLGRSWLPSSVKRWHRWHTARRSMTPQTDRMDDARDIFGWSWTSNPVQLCECGIDCVTDDRLRNATR